jgi:subtilisin family serine protease
MSSKNVYCHIFIIYFSLISNCLAESNDLPYKEGELLVRFAPKTHGIQRTKQEKDQFLSSLNAGEVKRSYNRVQGLTLVKLPEGHKVVDALSKFKGKSEILYVEPNYKIKLCSTTPNDPCFVYQWGMNNSGQSGGMLDADIDAPEAWEIIHDACDIIVAVTDTGICAHSDLAQNMWVNQAELNGIPYYDDDHNGYTDDIYGWDFSGPDPGDKDPNDYYNENGSLYFGHGTHVAGIIGARGNNGTK